MYPESIFGIDSFHIIIFTTSIIATTVFSAILRKEGVPFNCTFFLLLLLLCVTLIGAKTFSLFLRNWQFGNLNSELRNGWNHPGALIILILMFPLLSKIIIPKYPVMKLGDRLAIIAAFSLAAIRSNCILKGCCVGKVCEGIFCLSYAPKSAAWYYHIHTGLVTEAEQWSPKVLPLHLFFMIAALLIGFLLIKFEKNKPFDGSVMLAFLFLHEASKAALETFRDPRVFDLQIVSASVAAISGILLLTLFLLNKRKLGALN